MNISNIDEFFELGKSLKLTIKLDKTTTIKPYKLNNDALFQLPFISMIILLMSKDIRKPNVSELGQIIGECIERSIKAFKGSSQHLGWSAHLRIRTVTALNFLEASSLVDVDNRKGKVKVTDLGKKVISKALDPKVESDLSFNLLLIQRNYKNICKEKQMELDGL